MSERITNYELMVQFKDDRLSHMLKFEGAIQTALGKAYKVTAPTVWLPFTLPTQSSKENQSPSAPNNPNKESPPYSIQHYPVHEKTITTKRP